MNALKSNYGKFGAAVLVLGVLSVVYLELHASGADVNDANTRNYLDTATGKPFKHTNVIGETSPITAPSGGKTGYPCELCYWNSDGSASDTPTYVVLNPSLGKPGPTFCPTCHRLVVPFNLPPSAATGVPPTEAEWKAKHMRLSDTGANQ